MSPRRMAQRSNPSCREHIGYTIAAKIKGGTYDGQYRGRLLQNTGFSPILPIVCVFQAKIHGDCCLSTIPGQHHAKWHHIHHDLAQKVRAYAVEPGFSLTPVTLRIRLQVDYRF